MKIQVTSRLLAGALLATTVVPAFAQTGTVAVRLDGQPLALSAAPLEVNGRTLLPLRDVFESLGLGVNWNPIAQSIDAQGGTTQIQLGINNRVAFVNGRNVPLDQPAILVGGHAFVPLRFVAEATGASVDYNAPLQLVSIQKQVALTNPAQIADYRDGSDYSAPAPLPIPADDQSYRRISVPADAVVPVQLDSALSSSNSRVGQRFTASVVSRQLGDSEFPAGTKLEGMVVEARPSENNHPGVLDLSFQNAILPNGTTVPLRGELTSLDQKGVSQRGGRLVAKGARKNDTLKVVGIGAGAGFILGKVLGTNSTFSTILGAGGGYLFGRSRDRRAEDARLAQNTTLGVRLLDPVRFRDTDGYASLRQTFLGENNSRFNPRDYGYDTRIDGSPNGQYPGYSVADRLPDPAPIDDGTRQTAPDYRFNDGGNTLGGDVFGGQNGGQDNANDGFGTDNLGSFAQRISVPSGAVIPIRIDQRVSSATARVGDQISASIDSQRIGDSEFPAGTRILGTVVEARPRQGNQPGVLDFDFRTAQLPTGERVPLRGELISLDDQGIQPRGGRLVATRSKSSGDRAKVIGIGAVAGFAIGRLLGKNGVLPAGLGALGGYLYGQKNDRSRANEAIVPQNARLGLRLNDGVNYNGGTYYASRAQYLAHN